MSVDLSDRILPQAAREDIAERMRAFYASVDGAINARKPTCWNRGLCCSFGKYGHRLFVTDVELAYFVRGMREEWRPPDGNDACPYQVGGKCTAREHRPLGCRVFFCDPDAQAWQGPMYEERLAELKGIGEELGVDYGYREWLSALGAVSEGLAAGSAEDCD